MGSKTRIVVLHMKELIYTGIFVLLGILFLILLIIMFSPGSDSPKKDIVPANSYVPGVYTTSLVLNNQTVDIEVVVDENNINSIRLVNLDEAITTMYPLIEPAFDQIAEQIQQGESLDQITYQEDNRYTSTVLLQAIKASLDKASATDSVTE